MNGIILATEEQIRKMVFDAISEYFSSKGEVITSSNLPDTLNLSGALKVLEENGFSTSKGKLYKMTSNGEIPFKKYGNKLIFSRNEIIEWANRQLTERKH